MENVVPKISVGVLDDDPFALKAIEHCLKTEFTVYAHADRAVLEYWIREDKIDVLILDLNFPNFDGFALFKDWKKKFPSLPILFCSGEDEVPRALKCLELGAVDFIPKPFSKNKLHKAIHASVSRTPTPSSGLDSYIFVSSAMKKIAETVIKLKSQRNLNVLIQGETGTGKEGIANWLHTQEDNSPFVTVNIPALPSTLLEAELFGVEKGAYTDAKQNRTGKFERANGGDIFLDEIGEMSYELQSKLLRVLQEKQFEKVGGQKSIDIEFRTISATNLNLLDSIDKQSFRPDLYYRLSDIVISLPPLRNRSEDIVPLARHFIKETLNKEMDLSSAVKRQLLHHHWPGNIRELKALIKRSLAIHPPDKDCVEQLYWGNSLFNERIRGFDSQVKNYERELLKKTVAAFEGDKQKAQSILGLSRSTFYRKLSDFGID